MKKLLSLIAVMAMLLGLATVAAAGGSNDPATWDTSVFEIPEDLYVFHDDPADQDRYDYLGVECWEPIGLGIYHYVKGGVDFYRWLDKIEKIPAVTEENGGCFTMPTLAPKTVVFWNGVPNLPKDMFTVWEGKTLDVYIPDSVTEIDEDAFAENSTITLHFTAQNKAALAYAQSRGMAYVIVPRPTMDASVFVAPENPYEAGYDGVECMDIDLGIYHFIPKAGTRGIGSYFMWLGTMEKMPELTEENGGCFTPKTLLSDTVVFWDGVPNLSKNLFKWAEGKTKDVYIPDSVTEIDEDAFVENSTITLHFTAQNKVALAYAQSRGMAYVITPRPTMDASVFEIPADEYFSAEMDPIQTYMTCLCVCSDYLGIYHYEKGDGETGEAYFKWMNKWETMPDAIDGTCFCGVPNDPYLKTVVFWDGVPNLVNDLFKDWEAITDDVYIPDSVTEIAENCFVEGSHITLHFTANNEVALAYAQSRGMAYVIVPDAPEPDVSEPEEVSEPDVSEPSSSVSIFDGPANRDDVDIYECTCIITLKLSHFDCDGVAYFAWCGGDSKMTSDGIAETCFENTQTTNIVYDTVVFVNGVPNLCNDLFKAWETKTKDVYIPDSVTEIDEECFVEGSHITLHFTKNNAVALAYAQSRGMRFEVMDGQRMPGDVDFNKSVDMKDTLALRKSIANLPAAVEIYSTDVNGDGSTDMKDVLTLRRKIAHLDVISHREFDAAELGASVTVETYVQDKQIIRADGKVSLYTQSEDGAYFIYAMPCTQEEYDALTPGTGIRVSGTKSAWSGEVEITGATFEVIEGSFIAQPLDVTALLGTDELIAHQNERVVFRGVTVAAKPDKEGHDAAFLYGWDGSGEEGDDLYFDAAVDGKKITFTVESDLCGADTDVYKAVKALQVGDTVDVSGYLYWYDGPNPHVTAVTPAA